MKRSRTRRVCEDRRGVFICPTNSTYIDNICQAHRSAASLRGFRPIPLAVATNRVTNLVLITYLRSLEEISETRHGWRARQRSPQNAGIPGGHEDAGGKHQRDEEKLMLHVVASATF